MRLNAMSNVFYLSRKFYALQIDRIQVSSSTILLDWRCHSIDWCATSYRTQHTSGWVNLIKHQTELNHNYQINRWTNGFVEKKKQSITQWPVSIYEHIEAMGQKDELLLGKLLHSAWYLHTWFALYAQQIKASRLHCLASSTFNAQEANIARAHDIAFAHCATHHYSASHCDNLFGWAFEILDAEKCKCNALHRALMASKLFHINDWFI